MRNERRIGRWRSVGQVIDPRGWLPDGDGCARCCICCCIRRGCRNAPALLLALPPDRYRRQFLMRPTKSSIAGNAKSGWSRCCGVPGAGAGHLIGPSTLHGSKRGRLVAEVVQVDIGLPRRREAAEYLDAALIVGPALCGVGQDDAAGVAGAQPGLGEGDEGMRACTSGLPGRSLRTDGESLSRRAVTPIPHYCRKFTNWREVSSAASSGMK
jgi:hypothetical protein